MKIGDVVENFRLYDQFNNEFDLYKNLDQSVLLVFYPKDNTPVCTAQLVDYALIQKELISIGIKIVGINIDLVKSHNSFCINNNINFQVLSDSEKTVSKYYCALNLIGKNKRKLVLIGKDKKIKYVKSTLPMFFIHSVHLLNKMSKMQLL